MEIWKRIFFDGRYEVSNYGRVKGIKGKLIYKEPTKKGYLKVQLWRNNKRKKHSVHRLVAIHFLSLDLYRNQVNHKDFNKANNHISNLEWSTWEENIDHYQEHLKRKRSING